MSIQHRVPIPGGRWRADDGPAELGLGAGLGLGQLDQQLQMLFETLRLLLESTYTVGFVFRVPETFFVD